MKKILTVFFAISLMTLSGCSSKNETSPGKNVSEEILKKVDPSHYTGPYKEQFINISKNAKMQAILDIIDDSNITHSELQDVEQLYTNCMKKEGYKITFSEQDTEGIYPLEGSLIDIDDSVTMSKKQNTCYSQTSLSLIQSLYHDLNANPENGDMFALIAECLAKNGIAPKGYTADDYKYDVAQIDGNWHGIMKNYVDDNDEIIDEKGLIEVAECQQNPLGLIKN